MIWHRCALGFAAGIVLAGCGGSKSGVAREPNLPTYVYRVQDADVPGCAHAGKPIPWPSKFPKQFPVPSGTTINSTRVPVGGGIAARGFVPSQSFAQTVHFFPRHLKLYGFKVLDLEIDTPNDSEGTYRGFGYVGGWALRSIPGCNAMTFQVSAKPAGS